MTTDIVPATAGTVTPSLTRWRTVVISAVVTVAAAILLIGFARDGRTTWSLASSTDFVALPSIVFEARVLETVVVVALAGLTLGAAGFVMRRDRVPLWYAGIISVIAVVGFLGWTTAGHSLPVPGLLAGSLALSVPLIFGALGGVISERVGVVNIAIEGQLLGGAFTAAVVGSATHNVVAALVAAAVAGALTSVVLAVFAIRYLVDQVIVGIVLNVLVLGLTSFLYSSYLVTTPSLNAPPQVAPLPVPVLGAIPVLGKVLFQQSVLVYLMYLGVIAVFIGLYFTRWGLRLRAVGEHPSAADTVGIDVRRTRFWNLLIAGAIAGLGGAYFTVGSVGAFSTNITSGAGYIALAAVIFGKWNPIRATLAALLFGFASNLQNVLSIIGAPVPSDVMLMFPYAVTILAVAGLVGRSTGPAAAGKPFIRG